MKHIYYLGLLKKHGLSIEFVSDHWTVCKDGRAIAMSASFFTAVKDADKNLKQGLPT